MTVPKRTAKRHPKPVAKASKAGKNTSRNPAGRGKKSLTTGGRVKKEPPPATGLTAVQIGKLSLRLVGTRNNVFDLCRQMFQAEVGEAVFNELGRLVGCCRCELCSLWKQKDEGHYTDTKLDGVRFVCKACMDEVDPDGDD